MLVLNSNLTNTLMFDQTVDYNPSQLRISSSFNCQIVSKKYDVKKF